LPRITETRHIHDELQHLNDSQLCSIVALYMPIAAKVFEHVMSALLMIR
jgi:hypothetical protein